MYIEHLYNTTIPSYKRVLKLGALKTITLYDCLNPKKTKKKGPWSKLLPTTIQVSQNQMVDTASFL